MLAGRREQGSRKQLGSAAACRASEGSQPCRPGLARELLGERDSLQGFTGMVGEGSAPHTGDPQGMLLGWGSVHATRGDPLSQAVHRSNSSSSPEPHTAAFARCVLCIKHKVLDTPALQPR